MLSDIQFALRAFRDQRAFASAALLTLAIGIGAVTAIFSVVYGVLLRPLPFPDPDRLVQLSEVVPGGTPALPGATWISNLTIDAWESHATTIGRIATFSAGSATVGLDTPRRLIRGYVGPGFFDVLGVQPIRGRFFRDEDAAPGAAPVVVLSHDMWREDFGADPLVITRRLVIDERAHEIVGVAPAGILLPDPTARFWTPVLVARPLAQNGNDVRVEGTRAIARLLPGATTAQAAAEGTARARSVARPLAAEMLFGKGGPVDVRVRTLSDQMTVSVRPALLVLLVAVGVLLLIACANVANLFLSRGVSRERDVAVRVALGASRGRLIRQLLTESFVISILGGALGLALAWTLVRVLPAAAPDNFPRLDAVQLDGRALAVTLLIAVAAGLVSGMVPALRGARPDLVPALREGTGASGSRTTATIRRVLLAAEASLAVMLLIAAALLGRSFVRLVQTDAGYDASGVLAARIYLPGASRGQAQSDAFVAELLPRVRALPGVAAAGVSNMAPLSRSSFVSAFTVPVPGTRSGGGACPRLCGVARIRGDGAAAPSPRPPARRARSRVRRPASRRQRAIRAHVPRRHRADWSTVPRDHGCGRPRGRDCGRRFRRPQGQPRPAAAGGVVRVAGAWPDDSPRDQPRAARGTTANRVCRSGPTRRVGTATRRQRSTT